VSALCADVEPQARRYTKLTEISWLKGDFDSFGLWLDASRGTPTLAFSKSRKWKPANNNNNNPVFVRVVRRRLSSVHDSARLGISPV
jgi:hypothetical protein